MAKLTMTRRSFIKAAAVSAAAAMISTSAMTALAEDKTASTSTSDGDVKRIRTGCRGCGKVECAVWVTVRNGKAIKIEGDDSAWHANGNCCAKSQAGLQAAYHPDRIYYPLKRTAPIGDDDPGWVRISWEEGLQACADKLVEIRDKYGNESLLAFGGTSRQWANPRMITTYLGGANCFEAVEICKGPRRMTAATVCENGMHWIANVDYPLVYVQWGTEQTQSNYDDTCRTVNEAAHRSKCFISVDPRISNCGKIADYFLPLRPGTDLAMVLAWTHVVMEQELYDDYFVKYWSNATYLVCEDIEPSGWVGVKGNTSKNFPVKTRLLKESDMIEGGNPRHFMVWNNATDSLTYFDADEDNPHGGMWETQTEFAIPTTGWEYERGGWVPDYPEPPANLDPALWCENGFPVTLKDGRQVTVKTVWQTYWDTTIKDMTIAKAAEICEVDGKTMEEACKAWVVRYDERRGNGGLNIQLAPEQTGVSSQTFRASFILVFMTGNYDTPGGNRAYTRHSWSSSTNGNGPSPQGKFAATGKQSNMDARKKLCGCETFVTNGWWNQWNDANSCIDAALEG
ncbi:MAG: molybdopterin-dependent oxidoreductase, partial [Coriobacteriales bacterium]|nr:molybdopterin-dependent oxidoreductase [Coriobacteriales bacterium]